MDETTAFRSPGGMTLRYRGMTVHLEEGDPRIAFVDFLLFRDLPPPLQRPAPVAPEPEPEPEPEPVVEVPAAWQTLWNAVPEGARRLLVELSRRELTTPELEARLGMAPGTTRGFTIAIGQNAKKAGLDNPLQGAGVGRLKRRHFVAPQSRAVVLELDRRWQKVLAALDEVRQ